VKRYLQNFSSLKLLRNVFDLLSKKSSIAKLLQLFLSQGDKGTGGDEEGLVENEEEDLKEDENQGKPTGEYLVKKNFQSVDLKGKRLLYLLHS